MFALACALYRQGAWSEAYRLFSFLERVDDPAVLVNLALCHIKVNQWERALGYLDAAMSGLKKAPMADRPPKDEVVMRLAELERDGDGYLLPLPHTAPTYAPEYTRAVIRRLLVDCCAELGLWNRVQTLAKALKPGQYANVDKALARAK